jgi:hypothetical protein
MTKNRFMKEGNMKIHSRPVVFGPGKACRILIVVSFVLLFAHAAGMVSKFVFHNDYLFGLVPLFDFDMEKNVPTLFSVCLLLLNAGLFAVIWDAGRDRREENRTWLFLCAVFLFLAIDELSSVHEHLSVAIAQRYDATGIFHFVWVVPYGIAVVALGSAVLPTIWRLSKHVRSWFFLSGAVYVGGALGLEMVGGKYFEISKKTVDLPYALITTLEESMEIAGLIILVYALLTMIQREYGGFALIMPRESRLPDPARIHRVTFEANQWPAPVESQPWREPKTGEVHP